MTLGKMWFLMAVYFHMYMYHNLLNKSPIVSIFFAFINHYDEHFCISIIGEFLRYIT